VRRASASSTSAEGAVSLPAGAAAAASGAAEEEEEKEKEEEDEGDDRLTLDDRTRVIRVSASDDGDDIWVCFVCGRRRSRERGPRTGESVSFLVKFQALSWEIK